MSNLSYIKNLSCKFCFHWLGPLGLIFRSCLLTCGNENPVNYSYWYTFLGVNWFWCYEQWHSQSADRNFAAAVWTGKSLCCMQYTATNLVNACHFYCIINVEAAVNFCWRILPSAHKADHSASHVCGRESLAFPYLLPAKLVGWFTQLKHNDHVGPVCSLLSP